MKRLLLYLWLSVFLVAYASVSHAALKDYETWMGIYLQGKKLGFSYVKLKIDTREIVVNMKVYFRMTSEGVDQSTTFTQETHLTPDLKLKHFVLVQGLMGHRQKVQAKVKEGRL